MGLEVLEQSRETNMKYLKYFLLAASVAIPVSVIGSITGAQDAEARGWKNCGTYKYHNKAGKCVDARNKVAKK